MESRAIINIVDSLDSTSTTDALSANQGRVLKELIDNNSNEKNIITVTLNSINTQVNDTGTIPFSYNYTLIGDKLSLSNNRVVIGSGVTKVKISAHVWAISSSRVWFKVIRNETIIASMIGSDSCGYITLDTANKCITVSEGETIRIDYNNSGTTTLNQGSGNANETYLTVEVVE